MHEFALECTKYLTYWRFAWSGFIDGVFINKICNKKKPLNSELKTAIHFISYFDENLHIFRTSIHKYM